MTLTAIKDQSNGRFKQGDTFTLVQNRGKLCTCDYHWYDIGLRYPGKQIGTTCDCGATRITYEVGLYASYMFVQSAEVEQAMEEVMNALRV